jgi:hypothetical protein
MDPLVRGRVYRTTRDHHAKMIIHVYRTTAIRVYRTTIRVPLFSAKPRQVECCGRLTKACRILLSATPRRTSARLSNHQRAFCG